jgi:hypothetical protein
MQIARPAAPGTDGELIGQMRLGTGRKGGDFLVPDVDPLDLALAADCSATVFAMGDSPERRWIAAAGAAVSVGLLISRAMWRGCGPRVACKTWQGPSQQSALPGRRLNRFHVLVGEAEMMADLVDQHMGHDAA